MKKKRKWRYYCDHCKKSGGTEFHMKKHEARCTMNPERVCGTCEESDGHQYDMSILIAELMSGGIDALRDKTEGCPNCMLAAVRQSGIMTKDDEDFKEVYGWDYKIEKEAFWKEVNANKEGELGSIFGPYS